MVSTDTQGGTPVVYDSVWDTIYKPVTSTTEQHSFFRQHLQSETNDESGDQQIAEFNGEDTRKTRRQLLNLECNYLRLTRGFVLLTVDLPS